MRTVASGAGAPPAHGVAEAYDPFHEPLLGDPYPFFALARAQAPVFYAPQVDHWVVARYADVKAILLDPAAFSAANTIAPITPLCDEAARILAEGGWGQRPALGNNDPPDHSRFRRNVQRAFTPRRVAALEPFVRSTVEGRLDAIAARGRADLMAELIYDLPALVILELLGIPDDGVPIVREAGDNRVVFVWGRPTPAEQARLAAALVRFWHYLRGLIDERLAEPRDDLTSALLAVRGGDDAVFTLDEIASVLFAFLTAGHETTSSLIGNAAHRLLERRALWARLCADPSLIPGAVEEVLRGHGIHFCLGAALARLEARVAFEALTARLPSLRPAPGRELRFVPNVSFRGPLALEVEWDA